MNSWNIIFMISGFIMGSNKDDINAWKELTLEEKVGQMIMVRVNGNYYQSDNQYRESLKTWIQDYNVGGVIAFSGSVHGTFYNIIAGGYVSEYILLQIFQYWRN